MMELQAPPYPRAIAARLPSVAATRLALLSAAFIAAYWLSNRLTSTRSDIGTGVFEWERAIPFLGWTIFPYVSIFGFFALSFFVGRDRREFERHVLRLWIVLLVSVLCYAACPLRFTFERPPTTGIVGLLFDAINTFDLPYNRAPSLHISVLLILWVRFAPHVSGWLRVALHGWFALIGVSVLTTYQHHFVDVPAGLAAGWLCIALTARLGEQRAAGQRCGGAANNR